MTALGNGAALDAEGAPPVSRTVVKRTDERTRTAGPKEAQHATAAMPADLRESGVHVLPQRVQRVWEEWLQKLASDPEAALAAALAYRELDDAAREEWLTALDSDLDHLGVSKVAVYAPLLAVERDPRRRYRIELSLLASGAALADRRSPFTALCARGSDGRRLAVLVRPLYLDFVQVLACAYMPRRNFLWVRHDPIALRDEVPRPGSVLDGEVLDAAPAKALLDDLAETVVSHSRSGLELPEALCLFADLFSPDPADFGECSLHESDLAGLGYE